MRYITNPTNPTVRVAPGTTLTGSATLANGGTAATTAVFAVFAGGTLIPGQPVAGPGVLTTNGAVTIPTGSTYRLIVSPGSNPAVGTLNTGASSGSTPGQANGRLTTGAAIIIFQGGVFFETDLTNVNLNSANPYSFVVANNDGSASNVFSAPASFRFFDGGAETTSAILAQFTPTLGVGGGNVYLNLTPVPEPATVLLAAAAGLGGLRLARRRLMASSRRPG